MECRPSESLRSPAVRDSNSFESNVVSSSSALGDVWGGKTNQRFYIRRHNTVNSAHRGLRDLQNLSSFCFAINLVGLALTLTCAVTLRTSESCVWGLTVVTSSWTPTYHGSGTSLFTRHQTWSTASRATSHVCCARQEGESI